MSKQIITDAEYDVMKVLWNTPEPLALGDILKELNDNRSRNTVGTMLSRLCEKGVVSCHTSGKSYMYYAVLQKSDYVINETKSFLSKLYSGSVSVLVKMLYERREISDDETVKLKNIINRIDEN
jgi:BlaI family penicillinase repressor